MDRHAEKFNEQSLKEIRESNAGDKWHFDLGFNGVDWFRLIQLSKIAFGTKICQDISPIDLHISLYLKIVVSLVDVPNRKQNIDD